MTKKTSPVKPHYAAVLSLDPSGTVSAGLALRLTSSFALVPPARGALPAPQWTWHGAVVGSSDWADALAEFGLRHWGRGDRVGLVVENSCYSSLKIAKSLGQSIGAVRFGLRALNLQDDIMGAQVLNVVPRVWRDWAMPAANVKGRKGWKEAARGAALGLYGYEDPTPDADVSEAILMNDWACVQKRDWWLKGKI